MDKNAEQEKVKNEKELYSIILFVINDGAHSKRAEKKLKNLCEEWLPHRYDIEVVDVVKDFQTALDYNILLTPSVVITNPKPQVTIHGDLSDARKFIAALKLEDE
ncbi:MAG: circadian clock KaiB family protein [Balneolaceae bacterium]